MILEEDCPKCKEATWITWHCSDCNEHQDCRHVTKGTWLAFTPLCAACLHKRNLESIAREKKDRSAWIRKNLKRIERLGAEKALEAIYKDIDRDYR